MLPLAADEDLDWDIVRGFRRRLDGVDMVTVREAGMSGSDDPAILEWAANLGRVLLSHDVNTMTKHAIERISAGRLCPGIILVLRGQPLGTVIEDLALIVSCYDRSEMESQIRYLPLR